MKSAKISLRGRGLLELEQECMEVYKRKVDSANISRSRLHHALAESEAEFTHLLVSLGERSLPGRILLDGDPTWFQGQHKKMTGTLKEQLDSITPALQEMQLRKEERVKQFQDIQMQIQEISTEIAGNSELDISFSDAKIIPSIGAVGEEEKKLGYIDPEDIKVGNEDYYRYVGSLTVPPCTEGVTWTVLKKVRTVSEEQVMELKASVDDHAESNARPVQAHKDRTVWLYVGNSASS